jgi:dTDP-4-dehydrorhamnose reductase
MNGTLAPYIYDYFKKQNVELIIWERSKLPIDDQEAIQNFITDHQPDLFLHIATGPITWIRQIIDAIKPFSIPLVFTSSEAVFNGKEGPFTPADITKANDDYGHYKIDAEMTLLKYYPEESYIIRLGWQIACHTHKNNMLAYLVNEGHVKASTDWILSTSFMPVTAEGIYKIVKDHPPGIYHLDSNTNNMSFYDLVVKLKEVFMLPITIEKVNTFKHNNRLLSDFPLIESLENSFKRKEDEHHL